MSDKLTLKPRLPEGTSLEATVVQAYPTDPREIPISYSNQVAILTSESDVTLDFFHVQPQTVAPAEVGGKTTVVSLLVHRVVVPRSVAMRMARIIIDKIEKEPDTPKAPKAGPGEDPQ